MTGRRSERGTQATPLINARTTSAACLRAPRLVEQAHRPQAPDRAHPDAEHRGPRPGWATRRRQVASRCRRRRGRSRQTGVGSSASARWLTVGTAALGRPAAARRLSVPRGLAGLAALTGKGLGGDQRPPRPRQSAPRVGGRSQAGAPPTQPAPRPAPSPPHGPRPCTHPQAMPRPSGLSALRLLRLAFGSPVRTDPIRHAPCARPPERGVHVYSERKVSAFRTLSR